MRLFVSGINGNSSQTTSESNPETSSILSTELTAGNPATEEQTDSINVNVRLSRSQSQSNESLENYATDDESRSSSHTKSVNIESAMIPESASKVILPQEPNESNANNIAKTVVKKPTIHAVKELTDDDFKNFRAKKISKKSEHRAHVQYDEKTGELIGGDHPCHRECKEGEEPMICYYMFHLEWYQTMSKACYDCPFNETDCQRLDCIPADGMSRALNVINRKMPGPAIEVRSSLNTCKILI